MRPAGVFGDVAAQTASPLAGRIGRIAHPVPADVRIQIQIDHPRLHHGVPIFPVNLQNPVHPRKSDLNPVGMRNSPPR